MTKKRIIRTRVADGYISLHDLEGPIDSVIRYLTGLKDTWPDKQLELSLEYDPYDEGSSLYLYERREETKEEYEKRKAEAKAVEDRQRQMYEELKKKFGDSDDR